MLKQTKLFVHLCACVGQLKVHPEGIDGLLQDLQHTHKQRQQSTSQLN
jgi:hypothetical protein